MNRAREKKSAALEDSSTTPVVDDLNIRLHDSSIPTEDMYKQLELIDPQSARKTHPNERRKICR
jgi:tRNA A37 N6-isopentenylltransferase MiaA